PKSPPATGVGPPGFPPPYPPEPTAPPPATTATTSPNPPTAEHPNPTCTIRPGDTLSTIARRRLGDPDRWPTIFRLNRGTTFPEVGGRLTDPDVIYPGWKLRLPTTATTPASGHCTGKTAPARHQPAPTRRPHPGAGATTPPAPSPQATPPTDGHSGKAITFSAAGLTIAGFVYAGGLLWRRRHDNRPAVHATATSPAPHPVGALTLLRRSGRTEKVALPDPQPAASEPPTPDNPVTALVGPGAPDAARAALVAVLTGSTGHAVSPAATVTDLLGDTPAGPALAVTPDFAHALATVDEEIIRRSRLTDDLDDGATLDAPGLLLLAEVPESAWHTRLAGTARLGAPLGIDVTLLGDWPSGTTLTVTEDGTTERGALAVLDPQAAATILAGVADTSGQPVTAGRVNARVLGRPAILGRDGTPVRGLRSKALELFVYLVLNRDGAALGDIMEALWPDVTLQRATDRLSTSVANLRTVIRAIIRAGTTTDTGRLEPVVNTGGRYHLNADLIDVDWWQILDTHKAISVAVDDEARLHQLREVIAVAAGRSLAEDAGYDWIGTDREHARRLLIRIHLQAARLLTDADPQVSHTWYEAASDYDPSNDDLARQALHAAARLDDITAIHHRCERLRRALADAGLPMHPDTERFAADLLRETPATHR
ncbi:LysM peptidoglycan-binding domain-containing protein, partial [Actinoplanes awajinensis]|uniref:LysM peptidoglycan-binding domain-containing protein n=1 Tax=Actinoplanes awajinensis TaxID=135946 RepID=UPI000AE6EA96